MMPNPRHDDGNLATILTWKRNLTSPDENPYPEPQDCVEHLLRKKFDPVELCRMMLEDKHMLSYMRVIESCGKVTVEQRRNRDAAWSVEMSWDVLADVPPEFGVETDEDLFMSLLAKQRDVLTFLKQHIPLRTVFVLEHGVVRYSTSPFADTWDSGACGIAFIDPYADNVPDIDRDTLLAVIDAEVAAYDAWANGEYDEDADWFEETNLRCPECGHTANFVASAIILQGPIAISPDGWDWSQAGSAEFCEHTRIACDACGHEAPYADFQPND